MSRNQLNPYWAAVNLLKGQNTVNKKKLHLLKDINGQFS